MIRYGLLMTLCLLFLPVCHSAEENEGQPFSASPDFNSVSHETPRSRLNWMGHWKDEDMKEKLVRDSLKVFSFLNQDMEINLRFPTEIPEIGVKDQLRTAQYIASMIRENDIRWDVVWMDDLVYYYVGEELGSQAWGRDHLFDFSQLPEFTATQKDFILQGRDYRPKTGGILVGPYIEGYLYLLWYNQSVAEKIGLNIQSRGLSFNTFLGYIRQAYSYNQHAAEPVDIIFETKDLSSINLLFQNLVVSRLEYSETLRNRLTNLKKASLMQAFQAFEALGQYQPLSRDYLNHYAYESMAVPLQDKVLFYPSETGMYSHWRAIDREKMQKMIPIELPAFQGINDSVMGGYRPTWAVLKNAPNREAGVRLLSYLASPRMAEKWILYTKNPTGLKGNLLNLQLSEKIDIWTQFYIDMHTIYGSRVRFSLNTAYLLGEENKDKKGELEQILLQLITGKITAREAYSTFMKQINEG